MSSITINGQSYDIDAALERAELNHLMYLKQKLNMGMKSILDGFDKLKDSQNGIDEADTKARGSAILGAMEDEQVLNAFRAIVWMVRTKAGERSPDGLYLTVDAASEGVSLMDLAAEDDDAEDESSPKGDEPVQVAVTPS